LGVHRNTDNNSLPGKQTNYVDKSTKRFFDKKQKDKLKVRISF